MRKSLLATSAASALAALSLTACGAADSGSGSGDASASTTAKAGSCPKEPPGQTFAAEHGKDGTHKVSTAEGDVTVPNDPKRVVVLDTAELDSAITLGVKPVGATNAGTSSGFLSYLTDSQTDGIEDVGTIGSPNLEKVASLDPDLILTNTTRDGDRYDELKAIAPTVMTETTGYPWKQNFAVHADALNKTSEAKDVVAEYKEHVDQVTKSLGGKDKAQQNLTNVVRFVEGADTRIYACENYISTILHDVGLGRTNVVNESKDGFMVEVSPEQISKADADSLFYATYGDPEKAKEKEITDSSLWKNLAAVENDQAFEVDDELWIQGIGYTAAKRILNELRDDLG